MALFLFREMVRAQARTGGRAREPMTAARNLIVEEVAQPARTEASPPSQQTPKPAELLQKDEDRGRAHQSTGPIPDDDRTHVPARRLAGDTGDLTLVRREDHGTGSVTAGQPSRGAIAQGAGAIDEYDKGRFPHGLTLSDTRQV
jgi:hypothetical protein